MSHRMRIPFTAPFAAPTILPASAATVAGAIDALARFLAAPSPLLLRGIDLGRNEQTVLLTGAGISVASGLSDYRGEKGTYRRKAGYRPIFFHEYTTKHAARQRYWARSFIGWPTMGQSKPNITHESIGQLGSKGYISSVITQNVDSLHGRAHPRLPVVELHGDLRSVICVSCAHKIPREQFQETLATLNPAWAEFFYQITRSGALETDDIEQQQQRGLKLNPDGDVDLPNAHYSDFRYPACPRCLESPPRMRPDGSTAIIEADQDGALASVSNAGILKPAVVMFGQSVDDEVKLAAEEAVDEAGKLLVLGSSLATFSAWRLVERAVNRGMAVGVLNVGGFRNENLLFEDIRPSSGDMFRVRCSQPAEDILPHVVGRLAAL
ncbi:NAD-dependent deacetylase sirtuin-4 [Nannizzia gypsea CBS 118893]|uniref:NAD-dependent deacetylase sirtuin-4 n=1 Tax=Arthroderma gypseum (strain ATCC MYA-4604 / CBS 118893) TaxID=535722 RepID=E4UPK1_ARTGP|nr:NAD-dependent deacetylase sirtuin-4 [Nannizzia gypsea CBS 118893]EFQ99876.1 NAD-dependent deacetylase sirtuin-4 [Nannizzia gypsea CBS 118893]